MVLPDVTELQIYKDLYSHLWVSALGITILGLIYRPRFSKGQYLKLWDPQAVSLKT